jgi:branched-chain amino acid transport system ATP-binding protein
MPPHCSMGFNQTWILPSMCCPSRREKYGRFDAEAVRKAALDVDVPPGGTIPGLRRVLPAGTQLSGQNERSTPVVMQNAGEHISVVWPDIIKTRNRSRRCPPPRSTPCADDVGRHRRFPGAWDFWRSTASLLKSGRRNRRAHRAQRIGQEHDLQSRRTGALRPTAGCIRFRGKTLPISPSHKIRHRGIARTFQIPRPFRKLSLIDNVMLAAYYGEAGRIDREEARRRAEQALGLVGLPSGTATIAGLGAAALKKLELARALATRPKLLLADESLGGLDTAEMERAANLLAHIRSRMGITIVWVEHIMGVLMRVVERVIVLDHGEKIFDGLPAEAARDARVAEVYLGRRA